MFLTKKRGKSLLSMAGCALFATSVHAAATEVMSQPFATAGDVTTTYTTDAKWTGYGTVEAAAKSYSAACGLPIADENGNVLTVNGKVTADLADKSHATMAGNTATVDLMVQIAKPDEALAIPSSESATETSIQMAVGVESNGLLKVYCTPVVGNKGWYALGTTEYTEGSWHRVSFTFDYGHSRCLVAVDGNAAATANGYVTADGSTTGGAWYTLANTPAAAADKKISSITIIGSTAVDDMLVKHSATAAEALPAIADGNQPAVSGSDVTKDWMLSQGLPATAANTTAADGSGMTYNEKFVAGYEAADGKTFAVTNMTMSGATATFKFPAVTSLPSGYSYKLSVSADGGAATETAVDATTGSVTVNLGDARVTKYQLKVVK